MIVKIPVAHPIIGKVKLRNVRDGRVSVVEFSPYNAICVFERSTHPVMSHWFDAELVCEGCGVDWNEHQLAGEPCPMPVKPIHWWRTHQSNDREKTS